MTDLPTINPRMHAVFTWYAARFLRKNTHQVRMLRDAGPMIPTGQPAVVCMNHPSWWDPMIGMMLVRKYFLGRRHFIPIDADALEQYKFFKKLGFFGVERDTRRGAADFVRIARRVLEEDDAMLWVTAQGHFTDPRVRPVVLRPGVAHLARRMGRGVIVPLAIELPFWEERCPEVLFAFGPPIDAAEQRGLDVEAWNNLLQQRLETVMEELRDAAITQDASRFETVDAGRTGVGGVYDLWRRAAAGLHGKRFDPSHGRDDLKHVQPVEGAGR